MYEKWAKIKKGIKTGFNAFFEDPFLPPKGGCGGGWWLDLSGTP